MYQVDQIELNKSFQKRGLYAEKIIQDKASFLNGKSKVFNYMLQDAPSGDSLPVFVIPASEKFLSLVSFMVQCSLSIDREFTCQYCFQRNECLRKVFNKIQTTISKMNHKRLTIDQILDDYTQWRRTPRLQVALDLIVEIMIDLGEVRE